jgi:hypothetical protein
VSSWANKAIAQNKMMKKNFIEFNCSPLL